MAASADDRDAPDGLRPLPTLPVFFKLRGRRALIAGGSEPAVWKAEVLCAAGAEVEVVAADICSGLHELAARLGPAMLRLTERPWRADDLRGAALALGAIEEVGEAARFHDAANKMSVPVNVIDKPAFCDFQFGTLVARGPLVLAITTDGAAPVFGQAIRARLEAWLPEGLAGWAQAAKDWRPRVQERGWSFRRRRRFWEIFADLALTSTERAPTEVDLAACFAAVELPSAVMAKGSITLVGSGPGHPDDLTFAAARSLQTAEMLLFDFELPPSLVNLARREAARCAVDEVSGVATAISEVATGKNVVWLGTGNPATCRRWLSRALELERSGLAVTRIDGLSYCPLCAGRCPGQNDRTEHDR